MQSLLALCEQPLGVAIETRRLNESNHWMFLSSSEEVQTAS